MENLARFRDARKAFRSAVKEIVGEKGLQTALLDEAILAVMEAHVAEGVHNILFESTPKRFSDHTVAMVAGITQFLTGVMEEDFNAPPDAYLGVGLLMIGLATERGIDARRGETKKKESKDA